MAFLPAHANDALAARARVEAIALEEGLATICWRDVPVDLDACGSTSRPVAPRFAQIFLAPPAAGPSRRGTEMELERLAFMARKRIEHEVAGCYFPSLSSRTFIYKGMLASTQLRYFFPDLSDLRTESALALVHSRFSTNTFPSWPLAHPYLADRAHNGEINTVAGNRNWMRAREALLESDVLPGDLTRIFSDRHAAWWRRFGLLRRSRRALAPWRAAPCRTPS